MAAPEAASEWRRYPMLPVAAALGYATSVIHIYGLGPYIEPISTAFGWSRTQTTLGLTLQTLVAAVFAIPMGMLVDRIGPRRLALFGVVATTGAFALLGTATGSLANWLALWSLLAIAALFVQTTIWTSAVATRFEASRGMAFAVTLCGASVAQAIFPFLGAKLIAAYGWQSAVATQAGLWCAVALPLLLLFFRGAHDTAPGRGETKLERAPLSGATLAEGLSSSVYWRLWLASLLFTFTIIALVVHFVPILTGRGMGKLEAAGLAGLVGLFSIAGRLGTGVLLDRYRAARVGAVVFLLPVGGCLILIAGGTSAIGTAAAAALIGLTLGAEVDVLVYLTARHFGLKNFGALYGGLLTALSIGTATGPLGASAVFDTYGNYTPFLWLTIAFMIASSLALVTLPRPTFDAAKG
ncbi:MFS transporter [Sphingomonas sp. SUN039]|uniref:MFS transporter n=1 Tax=Sphingomonas sp. SUN039 TaxID=2937787 RepID=UPI002164007E|nr:MFS transporter [Sphingomonas sp. SUN039]UVO54262.1 MFS transporter [Sphingomonas sp. SUN039]